MSLVLEGSTNFITTYKISSASKFELLLLETQDASEQINEIMSTSVIKKQSGFKPQLLHLHVLSSFKVLPLYTSKFCLKCV